MRLGDYFQTSFFNKVLYEVKTSSLQPNFNTFRITFDLEYNKNKPYKTLNYSSRDMFNFDFLEYGLGTVSPPHFVYDFFRKMFLMLYSINRPNFIV